MKKKSKIPDKPDSAFRTPNSEIRTKNSSLRTRAENKLRQRTGEKQGMSLKDIQPVIHELQVHQIELEMQNEELRVAQVQLEESRKKYSDLYDFAPVGYFTFDKNGLILEVNLTGAEQLGAERNLIIKKPFSRFIHKDDQDIFFLHRNRLFVTGARQSCEIRLTKKDGTAFYAQLQSIAVNGPSGEVLCCRTAVSNITEQKKVEEALHVTSERYRSYIEVTGELGWTTNADGEVVEDLPSWKKYTGQTYEEIKGWGWSKALHPEDLERTAQKWRTAFTEKSPYEAEYRIRRHDGIYRYFMARGIPVFKEDGSIREWVGTCIDITERKHAEEMVQNALNESKQRRAEITALLEASRVVMEQHNFKDTARSIFNSCKALIGAAAGYVALLSQDGTENEVLFLDAGGAPCNVDPSLLMPVRGLRETAYRTGKAVFENNFFSSEWMKLMPKGHARLDNVMFAPLVISGETVGLLGLGNKPGGFSENDKRMASAFGELAAIALHNNRLFELLAHNEEKFRSVAQTATDAIISVDRGGNIIFWNKGAENIFGYKADEVTGKPLGFMMPEKLRAEHLEGLARVVSGGATKITGRIIETTGTRKDGSEFPLELSLATWETGEGTFFTSIIRDITHRRLIEEALFKAHEELEKRVMERTAELSEANELLENIFSNVHVLIAYMDNDFNIIRVNRKYAKSRGNDPGFYKGKNYFDLYPDEENESIFRKIIETGRPYFAKARPARPAERGMTFWDWSLKPVKESDGRISGLVLSLVDVTDNITLYSELMRSEHLASVGKLAAGVAHEVNNPINGIINYAQILLNKFSAESKEHEIAGRIIKESDRIAVIIRSLLSFARESNEEKKPVYLSEILSDSLALTEAQIRKCGINLEVRVPPSLPMIIAQPQHIEQVFLNLISNSCYALMRKYPAENNSKLLRISAEKVTADNAQYVRVAFYDQGAGIPVNIKDRIFDPFFTTKSGKEGTGLGLSISHGIISNHGGKINIESVEGEFTKVVIDLPARK